MPKLYECCDNNVKAKNERESLINTYESFKFLLGMFVWYDILFPINIFRMYFKSTCIDAAIKQSEDVLSYFEKYRKECFIKSMDLTKKKRSGELQMNVDLIFPTKHCVIRKKKYILERTMRNMKICH